MPTYQYRCTSCNSELEAVQKFSDPSLTVCPECDGVLRKVFNAVGVVFKGSGFYATDSRRAASASKSAATRTESPKPEPAKTEKSTTPSGSGSAAA